MSLLSPPLQAFMAIVHNHTVHAAAKTLHITQTAVTQRIRSLERQLKTTLFIRTRRGMDLTPEGEALYHYCQGAQELEGETLAKISGEASEATIQVCLTGPSSIMQSRVIPSCTDLLKKQPNLRLQFDIHDAGDPLKSLRLGNSQFAIIPEENVTRELQSKRLQPEDYVLVCPQAWQHRSLAEIIAQETIIDFNPSDNMTFNYLKHFGLYDQAKHERHYANRTDSIAMMIAAGIGYGVLTAEFSRPYVDAKQLSILNQAQVYQFQHVMVWYERPEPPAYFRAIIDAIN